MRIKTINNINMKTTISFYIILCIFSLFSCNNQEEKEVIDFFPLIEEIESEVIFSDSFFGAPYQIDLINNYLIICDVMDEKLISIYNTDNDSLVTQLFRKGNGPKDLIPPLIIKTYANNNISIFQRQTSSYKEYSLSDLSMGEINPFNDIRFDQNIDNLIKIDSNIYAGIGLLKQGSIAFFNKEGVTINSTNIYPTFINNIEDISNRFVLGQQHIDYNPNSNTLLTASIFTGDIAFFENNNLTLKETKKYKPKPSPIEYKVKNQGYTKPSNEDYVYFENCYSTNDYFYLLYSGNPMNKNATTANNYILQFDIYGNPVKAFKTNSKIFDFCISADNTCAYTISLSDDLSHIITKSIL